jgi:hypothetical protein
MVKVRMGKEEIPKLAGIPQVSFQFLKVGGSHKGHSSIKKGGDFTQQKK